MVSEPHRRPPFALPRTIPLPLSQPRSTASLTTAPGCAPPAPTTRPPAPPADVRAQGRMVDSHGRTIRDLRISLTDRCNFRCRYCMEPDVRFAAPESLLRLDEIVRIARTAESLGVRKIRLTGGEPTLRPDLEEIIAALRAATGVELAMISNGWSLSRGALRRWRLAGLDRITLSIDSLREERFHWLTRSATTPADVLAAIDACLAEGMSSLKVNAVLLKGVNDDEAADLAELARSRAIEVRFIEYMPLDSSHAWDLSKMVPAAQTRRQIEARYPLVACDDDDPLGTARTFRFADGAPGRVGFIAPVTAPFCGACSRLRVTADGMVRTCLFSTEEFDLRATLRSGASDAEIAEFLVDATWTKRAGHGILSPEFVQPARPMSAIGG